MKNSSDKLRYEPLLLTFGSAVTGCMTGVTAMSGDNGISLGFGIITGAFIAAQAVLSSKPTINP